MKQFYKIFSNEKVSPLATKLSWSHYIELLPIKDECKLLYYVKISIEQNLSRNDLSKCIKYNEYERLPEDTKHKLKKEYVGQIMIYMNYIDENIKTVEENKTVGIIICKQNNNYVIKYCSDDRILVREYILS